MSRITDAFKGKKTFIPFITCGDPDIGTTEKLVHAMAGAGADIIELGIPFSDPTAEGPVIQEANIRALSGEDRVTTDKIFDMVRRIRKTLDIPLVFMTYANVVFSYGSERFISACRDTGMDGLIIPDIPYEEKDEFAPLCRQYGIDFISLIAPTSEDRIAKIAGDAQGFMYCVSSLGVTGTRSKITTDVGKMVKRVKEARDIPCAIGFGISNTETAREMASCADGIIVGSAIIKIIAKYGKECVPHVEEFVRNMKEAANL